MISKIILENFFSFGEPATLKLNPALNILVGKNGSGKSNFLKAIRLLYESIAGDGFEKLFLRDWNGFTSVVNFNKSHEDYIKLTYEFNRDAINKSVNNQGYLFKSNPVYELTIFKSGSTSYYLKEKIFIESSTEGKSPFILLDMENSEGVISTREEGKVGFQQYRKGANQVTFKSTETILRQISDPDRYYPLFTLKRAIEGIGVYDYFDTTLKSQIRQPAVFGTETRLSPDGQNLMSILLRMKNHHSIEYEEIEGYIKNINPYFKDINFDFLGSKLYLVLREQYLSKAVSIEHISDGTLRFLLLLSILTNPERGSFLCIDEPEIGLHPDMINTISKLLKAASKNNTQVIAATHSPLLLNAFELDEVLIFEKDESNQTKSAFKTEEDFEEWNDNFLVGQLWLRGLIGGKRW